MAMEALVAAVHDHRPRRPIPIVVAFVSLSLCMPVAAAQASSLPMPGLYEYCAPASSPDGCVGRLERIAAGGFRVVLNYAALDAGAAQVQHYIDAAARLRLRLIWPMKEPSWWAAGSLAGAYPQLAHDCRCAGNRALLRFIVGMLRRSAATWGYYVADEPSPRDAEAVVSFAGRLRALDPHHPRLAVGAGEDSLARLLAPFAPAADVLGADSYPVGTGQPLDRVGQIGHAVDAIARAKHRRSAIVLQAFDWSSYPEVGGWTARRWPTRTEMRTMRDLAIRTAHPALILWYSYFDITRSDAASSHWRDVVWAATGA